MASTKKILTSIHGRLIGLAHDGKLVVKGNTTPFQNDAGATFGVQGAPGTLNATGTLTAALLSSGIVTSSTAAAVTATVDTGTAMQTALPDMQIGDSMTVSIINTGPNTFTYTAASGHTLVGAGAVATATSAKFLVRKTAANTFISYRIS